MDKPYSRHISIDDLRVVAELFKNDEIRFFHYLEQRLIASSETALFQHDEIEHVSLYNKRNHYYELPIRDDSPVSFINLCLPSGLLPE
jgi:hypothetical protein